MTDQSLRVLLLITSLETGGAQKQLIHLACGLKERELDILFISLMSDAIDPSYQQQLESANIPLLTLNARRGFIDLLAIFRIAQIARQHNADIIHSFLVHSNFAARLSRLFYSRPIQISSARNIIEGSWLRELVYRITDPLCYVTTQNSRAGAERYVHIKAVPAQKMRVILNVVDSTRFRPCPATRTKIRRDLELENAFVWLAVGRLVPVKNYALLLNVFHQFSLDFPQVRLLLVGDGPEEASLRSLARHLRIEDRVLFLGMRHDVHEIMTAADAYVMTSSREGTSNVLMEASATALPVIATRVGGSSEVVVDGLTGFLFEPEQARDLLSKMIYIMSLSGTEQQRMGRAGREYIETHYDIDANVNRWLELYNEALGSI